jgi:hypothetical protein
VPLSVTCSAKRVKFDTPANVFPQPGPLPHSYSYLYRPGMQPSACTTEQVKSSTVSVCHGVTCFAFASFGMFWVSFVASYFTCIVVMYVCMYVCVYMYING